MRKADADETLAHALNAFVQRRPTEEALPYPSVPPRQQLAQALNRI
jgi:hypothetical protein